MPNLQGPKDVGSEDLGTKHNLCLRQWIFFNKDWWLLPLPGAPSSATTEYVTALSCQNRRPTGHGLPGLLPGKPTSSSGIGCWVETWACAHSTYPLLLTPNTKFKLQQPKVLGAPAYCWLKTLCVLPTKKLVAWPLFEAAAPNSQSGLLSKWTDMSQPATVPCRGFPTVKCK